MAPGSTPGTPGEQDGRLADRIGYRFGDPGCSTRPWPTGRGAPSRVAGRRTSASSSSGTPSWAWSWPSTPIRTHPELSDGAHVQGAGLGGQHPRPGRGGLELGIDDHLRLGRGEDPPGAGPRNRSWLTPPRPCSGRSTSTVGSLRLTRLVLSLLKGRIARAVGEPGESDHKSRLQELTVRLGRGVPLMRWWVRDPTMPVGTWPRVYVAGQRLGTGEGRSKKDAEQMAAQVACGTLEVERGGGNA